jgi:hypothetical protein
MRGVLKRQLKKLEIERDKIENLVSSPFPY